MQKFTDIRHMPTAQCLEVRERTSGDLINFFYSTDMPRGKKRRRLTHRSSKSAPPSISTTVKPRQSTKKKKWTEEGMRKAIEAVETGESGVNRAALDYGVPNKK